MLSPRIVRPDRPGFTLIELLITIVLLGLVMGTLMNVILRQQRFYHAASEIIDTRSQVRQAADLLPSDLRGASTASGAVGGVVVADLYADGMKPHSLSYRSSFGSAISCVIDAGRTQIIVPPLGLASGNTLTSWLRAPVAGDSLFVFDEAGVTGGPGVWVPREIASVTLLASGCPQSTGFVEAADVGKNAWVITLTVALPATVPTGDGPGNPLRFFQPVTYELYQETDERWYLGYGDCRTGRSPVCSDLEPVSGPYLPPSDDPDLSGVTFEYLDGTGVPAALPQDVATIRMTFRSETRSTINVPGTTTTDGHYRDAMTVMVAVRNRS